MQQKIIKILAFICLGLFVYFVFKINPGVIGKVILRMTWPHFLILFFMRLVFWLIRTFNWKTIFSRYNKNISLWKLFWARLAGHTVGYLTPSSRLGGEAFKVFMVESSSRKTIIASAVVDKAIELLATILLMVIGVLIALVTIPMSGKLRIMFTFLAGLVIFAGIFILMKLKKGIFIWFIDWLKKIKIQFKFMERNRDKIQDTDTLITDFYVHQHKTFLGLFILYLLMIIWWSAEIYLNLLFIGAHQVNFPKSFMLVVLGAFAYLIPGLPAALGG